MKRRTIACAVQMTAALAMMMTAAAAVAPLHAQNSAAEAPAAPERLWAAQTSPTTIVLSWQAVTGATGYNLYCAAGDEEPRVIGRPASNATQWTLGVRPTMIDVAHRCALEAKTSRGLSERVAFNTVMPRRGGPAPQMPARVTAEQTAATEITVSWSEVPGATAYFIARSVAPAGYRVVCQLCPSTATYVDRDVTGGVQYSYSVAAITAGGTSRRVNSVALTSDAAFGLAVADSDSTGVATTDGPNTGTPVATTGGNPGRNPGSTTTGGRPRPGTTPGGTPNPPRTTTGGSTTPTTTTTGTPEAAEETVRPCVLEYQRADNMWAAIGRPDGNLGTERLTLQPGQRRAFVTDWAYEKTRNDGSNYYGSHTRIVTNAGATPIVVQFKGTAKKESSVGIMTAQLQTDGSFTLDPGEVVELKADLLEASCDMKGGR